ncbi:MAG: hypothetical protein M3P49_16925 [Actinomycetota bacterium]|nr:hypothetical protein [Actinomycetota bacterium]
MNRASVTHIAGGWGSRATSSPSCREAVLAILCENRNLMTRFSRVCAEGIPALLELAQPVRRALQEQRHRFETHAEQLEETIAVLHDLAFELLPASPGAALGRLRARVAARAAERSAESERSTARDAVEAVEELVTEDQDALQMILKAALRESDGCVLEAARRIYLELYRRDQRWEPGNFSTHVRAVAASLFPPAWDESWARAERRRALEYICAHAAANDLPYLPDEYAEVYAAEDARDPERYRAAIRALVLSARLVLGREGRLLDEPVRSPHATSLL